ncbi:hypothetical protein [Kineococcus sp. NPDC059986]|uniref:hypothetical protein n=1 Tax=Kineococcus sp. NPDC059986 TaxID=3155538 RepID=UPI00344EF651
MNPEEKKLLWERTQHLVAVANQLAWNAEEHGMNRMQETLTGTNGDRAMLTVSSRLLSQSRSDLEAAAQDLLDLAPNP